ncbi:MAG: hypothetical protein ABJA37_04900 [Ferruginibacter sp.]
MSASHDDEIIILLKEKNIHITQPRMFVLQMICINCKQVFSAKDFIATGQHIDRTSIYRILQLFVKSKIVNKVPNTKGIVEYTLHQDFSGKPMFSNNRVYMDNGKT